MKQENDEGENVTETNETNRNQKVSEEWTLVRPGILTFYWF